MEIGILLLLFIFVVTQAENRADAGKEEWEYERKHIPASYNDSLQNVREGFLRTCVSFGIKVRGGVQSDQEKELILKSKRHKEIVRLCLPYTEEKFYLLIGFAMKAFNISYDEIMNNCSDHSLLLNGFNYSDCKKVMKWCRNNDIMEIRKALDGYGIH